MNIQEIRTQYPQYQDMSDEQLGKALHAKHYSDMPYEQFAAKAGIKTVGVGADVAKAIPSSVVRGMTNLAGAPADIWEAISGGMASLAGKFTSPETAKRIKEAAKPELPLPTSKRIQEGVEPLTGKLYKPQTLPGKLVGGTVEAAAPGGLFGKAQAGLSAISGLGSEVGGALSDDNPWVKAGAGLLSPLGVQGALAYRSIPGNMIREATGDITPQQFEQAKQFMERGKQSGIGLMAPEALPPSSIQQLASDVMASKEGGRVMNQFLAQRPEQVKKAVSSGLLDRVGLAGTPDESMARARSAATNTISDAEKFRSAAARPYYQAARNDPIPSQSVETLITQLESGRKFAGAANQKAIDDIIGQLRGTDPNAAALDDTYKSFRASADAPAINATPEQRAASGIYGGARDQLDATLKANSQNIKSGRDVYSQVSRDIIDPLTSGPVGRVAGKQGFDSSLPENLNPISAIANEKLARPESIRELYTNLNKQDPQAFPGMARTWLENAFDGAAQKVQAGENRMVGANFAKAMYGTPQQEANFLETMRGVAKANGKNPDDFAKGAKNLMEILQSTGKVAGVGSPTGGRIASNEMARGSKWMDAVESVSTSPARPLANRIRTLTMGSNYRKLAEIMTAPDSIDKIIQIGKYKPSTTTSMALAAGLLEANAEAGSAR